MNTTADRVSHYFAYALIGLFFLSPALHSQPISTSSSSQTHNHQQIINSARQFLNNSLDTGKYSRVKIRMGELDKRLKLPQCDIPLSASLAPGAQLRGKTTLHVRCQSTQAWTVYVSAHIKLFTQVIKTRIPLNKGHILQKADLIIAEEDTSRIRSGYFSGKTRLVGKQLKRRLAQDKLIKSNYVKSPTLVKRGEIVSIIAKSTGYSVKMTGTAMMNGALGDRIRVKNLSSKRIVEGTVLRAGIVNIN